MTDIAIMFSRDDLIVALDFLEGEAEPLCGDLFEAVGFLRMLVEGPAETLRRQWPEWFTFYAARTGRAWPTREGMPA